MKISLNWLATHISPLPYEPEHIADMLTSIGLEVEGLEHTESLPGGLKGVVIGEVLTCERHPNADKLSVTTVEVGQAEPLNIVCGAPNVAVGQKVPVATVGTTLYPIEGEPFTLKKGKIRGEVSEGMICAEDELGIGSDHSGIMVLPAEVPAGTPASDFFEIETDVVFEIGLTPNRSDATSHLGVARDLAAYLTIQHGYSGPIPGVGEAPLQFANSGDPIQVEVLAPKACPRYAGLTIRGVKIGESPEWLKNRLRAVGIKPKNNVVDVTNYILHDLGQPLHAFDAAHLADRTIKVTTLESGTPFVALDEVERLLDEDDLMICDGRLNAHCIAGVFGGLGSGVSDSTTEVFLESAHFCASYVRKSSMRHQLRTDAAKVFEKGSDPAMVVPALMKAATLITELAGGEIVSDIIDIYPEPINPVEVNLRYAKVERLIGADLTESVINEVLRSLDIPIVRTTDEGVVVAVPTSRADVTREVDVIEEIVRIYGFDRIPSPEGIRFAHSVTSYPAPHQVRHGIAEQLAGNGFREMMALSLSQSSYYHQGPLARQEEALVGIHNTSNVKMDIMRPDLLMSALEAVRYNQNRQQPDVRLFEFGYVYCVEDGVVQEQEQLSLTLTGTRDPENWTGSSGGEVSFFTLKGFVGLVLARLGVQGFQVTELSEAPEFLFGLEYHRGPNTLVRFGRVRPELTKEMDIRKDVYFAAFNWEAVVKAGAKAEISVSEPGRFPGVERDLALVVGRQVAFSDMERIARKTDKKILQEVRLVNVYENEEQLGADRRSCALRFSFSHPDRTLSDKEVDKIMNSLMKHYETQLQAVIRR